MEKLSIKVLPCVVCFIDGVSRDRFVSFSSIMQNKSPNPGRLIGFEELGNNDGFGTAVLELRLLKSGLSIFSGHLAVVLNE